MSVTDPRISIILQLESRPFAVHIRTRQDYRIPVHLAGPDIAKV